MALKPYCCRYAWAWTSASSSPGHREHWFPLDTRSTDRPRRTEWARTWDRRRPCQPGQTCHDLDAHDRVLVKEGARIVPIGADSTDAGREVDAKARLRLHLQGLTVPRMPESGARQPIRRPRHVHAEGSPHPRGTPVIGHAVAEAVRAGFEATIVVFIAQEGPNPRVHG